MGGRGQGMWWAWNALDTRGIRQTRVGGWSDERCIRAAPCAVSDEDYASASTRAFVWLVYSVGCARSRS